MEKLLLKKRKYHFRSGKGLGDFWNISRNRDPQIREKLVVKPEMELRSLDSQVSAHISRFKRICSEVILNDYSCGWIQGGPCQCIRSLYMKRQFFLRLNKKGKEYPWCTLAIVSVLASLMNSSHWNSVAFVSTQHQTGPIFNELLRMLSFRSLPNLLLPMEIFQEQDGWMSQNGKRRRSRRELYLTGKKKTRIIRRKENTSKTLSWEPNVKVNNTAPPGSCLLNQSHSSRW